MYPKCCRFLHFTPDILSMLIFSSFLQQDTKMAHLADLFSLPEMCLLSQVAQYFMDHNLQYHSVPLFNDVKVRLGSVRWCLIRKKKIMHFFIFVCVFCFPSYCCLFFLQDRVILIEFYPYFVSSLSPFYFWYLVWMSLRSV